MLVYGVWLFLWGENWKAPKFCVFLFKEKKKYTALPVVTPELRAHVSPGLFESESENSFLLCWAKLNWGQNTLELIVESAALKCEMMLRSAENNFNSWVQAEVQLMHTFRVHTVCVLQCLGGGGDDEALPTDAVQGNDTALCSQLFWLSASQSELWKPLRPVQAAVFHTAGENYFLRTVAPKLLAC